LPVPGKVSLADLAKWLTSRRPSPNDSEGPAKNYAYPFAPSRHVFGVLASREIILPDLPCVDRPGH
jgi:hypothetical protein